MVEETRTKGKYEIRTTSLSLYPGYKATKFIIKTTKIAAPRKMYLLKFAKSKNKIPKR